MESEKIFIPGPAGQIEALLEYPAETGAVETMVVLCHPHPLYGGSYTNKVVHILATAFLRLNMPVLRFNFRGVGKSAGSFDNGVGEQDDLAACVKWMQQRYPGAKLLLGGFSFGAFVAYLVHTRVNAARLLLVAPPLRLFEFGPVAPVEIPWTVIQGTEDEIVDVEAVKEWVAKQSKPPEFHLLQGASHFFHGRLNDLRDIILKTQETREE